MAVKHAILGLEEGIYRQVSLVTDRIKRSYLIVVHEYVHIIRALLFIDFLIPEDERIHFATILEHTILSQSVMLALARMRHQALILLVKILFHHVVESLTVWDGEVSLLEINKLSLEDIFVELFAFFSIQFLVILYLLHDWRFLKNDS